VSRPANLADATAWFQVMRTTARSQIAVMTLEADGQSSEEMNTHKTSDQVVLVVEGEIEAHLGDEKMTLKAGDFYVIPAGTPHRLLNASSKKAVTFNVYAPPEYPPGEKG
jgi:mannose-6-phosphate isomerase-like protein (cupin superfamily)